MTQLRQRMQEISGYGIPPSARFATTKTVAEFATYFHKSPDQLGPEHIRTFSCICSTIGSSPGERSKEPGRR